MDLDENLRDRDTTPARGRPPVPTDEDARALPAAPTGAVGDAAGDRTADVEVI